VKRHLYNSRLAKIAWFVRRFGFAELFLKPCRVVFAPAILPILPRRTFQFRGSTLECLYHRYNMTWACERCVEVPIARFYLGRHTGERILEVGNVLSHYSPVAHDILDKFERGEGVINQDIVDFHPLQKYGLILSISTFEHIGFDDASEGGSASKIKAAIQACRALLDANGRLVVTVPIGYNPELDHMLQNGELPFEQEFYLRRTQRTRWEPCGKTEALDCHYREPFPYANAILAAEFAAASSSTSP
jgi:hypothetical protein